MKTPIPYPGARFLHDTGTGAYYCEYCGEVVAVPKWCYCQPVGKYPACPECLDDEIKEQNSQRDKRQLLTEGDMDDYEHWERYIANITGELT